MIHSNQESKDRVRYGTTNIDYYIKRSRRIKTSELIVDSNRIEVRTPLNKTIEDTRNIIRDKAEWILRKQKEFKNSIPEIMEPTFDENSTLPYLGKNYPLRISKNQSKNNFVFADDHFLVDISIRELDENARSPIRELYEMWIIKTAYPILKSKVETYSQKLGVNVQRILIKSNLKSRWASLTRKGSINFNMNLIKAPQDVIDYIVLHEICHLRIRGHSHHYWDLVYRYMPNYQDKIEWLKTNGRMLIND
jgi:predicted metal-dependent hydrolase